LTSKPPAPQLILLLCCFLAACEKTQQPADTAQPRPPTLLSVSAALATETVPNDPDDPAIWIHPQRPENSRIVGTDKEAAPKGGLYVFDLQGKIVQTIQHLDRPNNVDIRQGIRMAADGTAAAGTIDIAVVTERYRHRLRIYRIDALTGRLSEAAPAGGIPVFLGQSGDFAEPMGIALYRRPADGALFAIVGRKSGPATAYLWQYRLDFDASAGVKASKVREFGAYSGKKEIEAIAVDDELGFVYYADETYGVRKYYADPDHPEANRELAVLAQGRFRGDHEGIAIYKRPDGSGYLICTDQIPGNSEYHVFKRQGAAEDPHRHEFVGVFRGGADATDGIDVTSQSLGRDFSQGLFVAMNSSPRNFLIYRWTDITRGLGIKD